MLRLKVLGHFELSGVAGPITLASSKLSALLAYLALVARPVPREQLATLLWGSHFEEQARQNLRQALLRLRKALGPEVLVSNERSVELAPTALECDAHILEKLARSVRLEDLRAAIGLLDGEVLAGIDVRETQWEEWIGQERRRINKLALDALMRLAVIEWDEGRPAEALRYAEDCIGRDYYREDAHRLAMQAMAVLGQRAEAVRHYQGLSDRLKHDLGTGPEPETSQFIEDLRSAGPKQNPLNAAVPARPSIAVLPFANLSTDPEQEYFADGVVEEIITALSALHWLFVIARNSSFTYKGRTVDVRQIGRELGVRYLLEGSVRKSGNKVRIAGQLVDATDGTNLWAGRSEGEMTDIFELQDRVTLHIIAAIAPRLEEAVIERSKHKPTASLDAYDCYLRGKAAIHTWTRQGTEEALTYFGRAIELDPGFAASYGMAARCYTLRKAGGWMNDRAVEEAEAIRLARRAKELGRDDAEALGSAGFALGYIAGLHEEGDALAERALQLNPNFAWGWFFSAWLKLSSGELEVAIERASRALKLSPNDPHALSMHLAIAEAHFFAGRYGEAVAIAESASRSQPDRFATLAVRAASYAQLGKADVARPLIARLLELEPWINLGNLRHRFPVKRDDHYARWEQGLRRAGLPE